MSEEDRRYAERRSAALRDLDAFMREAALLDEVGALCELGARTLASIENAPALVYVRDARAGAQLLWSAVAEGSGRVGLAFVRPSPSSAADVPALILADLNVEGVSSRADVHARDLGLMGEFVRARVEAMSVGSVDALGVWVGVLSSPRDQSERGAEAGEIAARLVAHHLVARVGVLQAESLRQDTEFKYRTMVEQMPAITYYRDLDQPGSASFMSPQCKDILGYGPECFIENRDFFVERLHPDDRERVLASQSRLPEHGVLATDSIEYRMLHREGHTVWLLNRVLATRDAEGNPRFLIGIIFDISETKQLEQQVLHAQKMEAVGRLASGIAHDFNNILAVIVGYGEFVAEALDAQSQSHEDILAVLDAADRAKLLVSQLLAFNRPPTQKTVRVRLQEVLDSMRMMVGRVLHENIQLEFAESPGLGSTLGDRGQLEQIIMNLLVNARDAMPDGGQLRVEASNVTLDESFTAACEVVPPGDYVMFCVSDSGVGMDEHTVQRLFEPFFTTKAQGTGLGMSTVLGLVRQHGGTLSVDSVRGRGTSVRVYLPRCSEDDPAEALVSVS